MVRPFAPQWPAPFAGGLGVLGGGGSILPLTIDFSGLPDGTLPSPLSGSTWAIANGKALNTPGESAELITDGGLENWSSATNLTSWTENLAGTSTVNRDGVEQRSGTFCARLDIDAGNDAISIEQSKTVSSNDWLITRGWSKGTAGKTIETRLNNQYPESVAPALTLSAAYQSFVHTGVVRFAASFAARFASLSAASTSVYFDDLSYKKLTRADLPAIINAGQSDVIVKGNWTAQLGAVCGVILNLDSLTNPQNYVILIVNGLGQYMSLIKCVAGTITQVALLNTITYGADKAVELRKTGTTYKAFYDGVQIGANQTISDAGIINNTLHGLFSTHAGCLCSFFSLAAA